jgi:hypothetical protein
MCWHGSMAIVFYDFHVELEHYLYPYHPDGSSELIALVSVPTHSFPSVVAVRE